MGYRDLTFLPVAKVIGRVLEGKATERSTNEGKRRKETGMKVKDSRCERRERKRR
jgi:hypothetical protein